MEVLFEFGLTSGVLISLVLMLTQLFDRQNKQLLKFRLSILALILFHFVSFYSIHYQLRGLFLLSELIVGPGNLLIGPLFFIYATSLVTQGEINLKKYYHHFWPSIIYEIGLTLPLVIWHYLKYYVGQASELSIPTYLGLFLDWGEQLYAGISLFTLGYLFWGFKRLQAFSTAKPKAEVRWAKYLFGALILYHAIELGVSLFFEIATYATLVEEYYLVNISLILVIYLAYWDTRWLMPLRVSVQGAELKLYEPSTPNQISKSERRFSDEEVIAIRTKLRSLMEEDYLFRQTDLNLNKLAEELGISNKKMSGFLNQHIGQNFYEFINSYRIADFQAACTQEEYEHLSLWGIANHAGFRSKTSFNRVFKKQTGITPSEFYRQNNKK